MKAISCRQSIYNVTAFAALLTLTLFTLALWPCSSCHTLQWRHNGRDSVSNHQPHDCLLNRSDAEQRKHQSSVSLAFVCGEFTGDRWIPPHKWPVTRKMLPVDDVIMTCQVNQDEIEVLSNASCWPSVWGNLPVRGCQLWIFLTKV